jgi:hypothetical protein
LATFSISKKKGEFAQYCFSVGFINIETFKTLSDRFISNQYYTKAYSGTISLTNISDHDVQYKYFANTENTLVPKYWEIVHPGAYITVAANYCFIFNEDSIG